MINYKEYTEQVSKMGTDNLVEAMFHMVINWGESNSFTEKLPIQSENLQARLKLDDSQMAAYVTSYLTQEVLYHSEQYMDNVDMSLVPNSTNYLTDLVEDFYKTWKLNSTPNPLMVALKRIQELEEQVKILEREAAVNSLTEHQVEFIEAAIKCAIKDTDINDLIEIEIGANRELELELDEQGLLNNIMLEINDNNIMLEINDRNDEE